MDSLILSITPFIGVAIMIWLITSKKFRASIGSDITMSVEQSSGMIVDSLRIARVNQEIDWSEDLTERGLTAKTVKESRALFDTIVRGNKVGASDV